MSNVATHVVVILPKTRMFKLYTLTGERVFSIENTTGYCPLTLKAKCSLAHYSGGTRRVTFEPHRRTLKQSFVLRLGTEEPQVAASFRLYKALLTECRGHFIWSRVVLCGARDGRRFWSYSVASVDDIEWGRSAAKAPPVSFSCSLWALQRWSLPRRSLVTG